MNIIEMLDNKATWFLFGAITYYCTRELAVRYYKWFDKKNCN